MLITLLLSLVLGQLHAEPLPLDSGIIDVRNYGAVGNGVADDTAALLHAIAASGGDPGARFWQNRIVYLPNGVYRLSGTLLKRYASDAFAAGLMLMGESREHTELRLTDRSAAFGDPAHPAAIIFTSSTLLGGSPTAGGKHYEAFGEGNDAYMNSIEDLTIDVGEGNPGAIGIDYLANNIGVIRNVLVRAGRESGASGISMVRRWPGPALLQDVQVEGFAVGIDIAHREYGVTLEHVRLIGQRNIGLRNRGNVVSIHDLAITAARVPIVNEPYGLIALADARFVGRELASAVANTGTIVFRNARTVEQTGTPEEKRDRIPAAETGQGTIAFSAGIIDPVEPPFLPRDPLNRWVSVGSFMDSAAGGDATEALKRAFASGAETVYLPHGVYTLSGPVDIPPTLRRIVGMNSTLEVGNQRSPALTPTVGLLRIRQAGAPIAIERLGFDNYSRAGQVFIELSAPRDLIVREVVAAGAVMVQRSPKGGRLFLADTCCGALLAAGQEPIYARQFDTEGKGNRIVSIGAPIWVLGLKTEGNCTVVDARAGAAVDIFGGLLYMVHRTTKPSAAFQVSDATLSATFAEAVLLPGNNYDTYVKRAVGNDIDAASFPARGHGRVVPNLVVRP